MKISQKLSLKYHKIRTLFLLLILCLENTVKFLNFQTPENFAVIYLKFKQRGQTSGNFAKKANGIAYSGDPDHAYCPRSSLIWICTVCPDLPVQKHRVIEHIGSLRYPETSHIVFYAHPYPQKMSCDMRKPTFAFEKKNTDQLCGNEKTCFLYMENQKHNLLFGYMNGVMRGVMIEKTNVLHMQKQRRRSASR